jgi:DinB superfamily
VNKHDLLISLAVERARLFHALLGASASDLESAQVCGDWSPRDVLAHIIAWERYVYDVVRYLRARQPVPPSPETSDEDTYNARAVAVWRTKPLQELLDTLAIAHRQLMVAVAGCSQAQLDFVPPSGTGVENIASNVMSIAQHDAEHARQIRARRGPSRPDDVGPKVLLQHALNTSRAALMALMDVVPAPQRESLPVTGEWTLKDVVGHIADWDEIVVEATLAMEANQRITWEPIDYGEAWNQSHAAARRTQSWAHVWQNFIDVRGTIVTELAERVMEPDLGRLLPSPWGGEMSFYVCLAIPCRHDMEHVETLLAWQTLQSAGN